MRAIVVLASGAFSIMVRSVKAALTHRNAISMLPHEKARISQI
jgi:hypothetical protein